MTQSLKLYAYKLGSLLKRILTSQLFTFFILLVATNYGIHFILGTGIQVEIDYAITMPIILTTYLAFYNSYNKLQQSSDHRTLFETTLLVLLFAVSVFLSITVAGSLAKEADYIGKYCTNAVEKESSNPLLVASILPPLIIIQAILLFKVPKSTVPLAKALAQTLSF